MRDHLTGRMAFRRVDQGAEVAMTDLDPQRTASPVKSSRGRKPMTLDEALKLPRVAIAGGPHTGKSKLAERFTDGRLVLHTDDLRKELEHLPKGEQWSALSALVVSRLAGVDSFVVEGVRVAHALRKGLKVDAVVWCTRVYPKPGHPRKSEHDAMAKATLTVFKEWLGSRPGIPVVQP